MRLVILLLSLPWWAYFFGAGGVVYVGQQAYERAVVREAERAEALALGAPEIVDLSDYDPETSPGLSNEVNVVGWINTNYNYTLVKRTNGVKTSERYLYMLFGSTDDGFSREVRAAMVFSDAERDAFLGAIDNYVVGLHEDDGHLFALNGFSSKHSGMSDMVTDAIAEQSLVKAPDFFYLEPFLDGREAALTPQGAPERERLGFLLAAAVIAFFGVIRKLTKRKATPEEGADPTDVRARPSSKTRPEAGPTNGFDIKAHARDTQLASSIDPDSPIGRLAMRNAPPPGLETVAEVAPWSDRPVSLEDVAVDAHERLLRQMRKSVTRFAAGCFIYGCAIVTAWNIGDFATFGLVNLVGVVVLSLAPVLGIIRFLKLTSSLGKAARAARLTNRDVAKLARARKKLARDRNKRASLAAERQAPKSGSNSRDMATSRAPLAKSKTARNSRKKMRTDPFKKLAEENRSLS